MIKVSHRIMNMRQIKLGTFDGDGERVPEGRGGMHKTTFVKTSQAITRCRQEMIVETTQVCRAAVVMTSTVEPCHVEPCRPATWSCNLFCAQLAVSVDLSILVLYGHISAVRRQCAQHYSGSVVAETLSILDIIQKAVAIIQTECQCRIYHFFQ